MESFKNRLKELREEAGLSMQQLADLIGVSGAAVCKWENGNAEPKVSYLNKLSAVFDCSVDFLIGKTDEFGVAPLLENQNIFKLDVKEKNLIASYRKLNPTMKSLIQITVDTWAKTDEK